MPVSRVEPFTRVYNWPNTKMDGRFRERIESAPLCVSLTAIRYQNYDQEASVERDFSLKLGRNRILQGERHGIPAPAARNHHIIKGISVYSLITNVPSFSTTQRRKHSGWGFTLTYY